MDTTKKFHVGDLVWGKMRSFPPWPARVLDPPKDKKIHVYFFGTQDHAFLPEECVVNHSKNMLAACKRKKKMSLSLRAAINELTQCTGSNAKRSRKVSLKDQKGYVMQRRPATLSASIKVQLKLKYQRQQKRKSMLRPKVSRKKDTVPRAPRPVPTDVPYDLRSRIVLEPVPEPVPDSLPPEPVVVEVPLPPCGVCRDREGATDKKVETPCCVRASHMSCILRKNKGLREKRCPYCYRTLNIGMRVVMEEKHRINFSYEFYKRHHGLWTRM